MQALPPEHPRVCGENDPLDLTEWTDTGTSPHTRGKLAPVDASPHVGRNIPAYAGKTHACTFCLLLASRGAVYSRDTVLLTEAGKKYHDNCRCLGIEVQTPADLPRINQELEQIYIKSGRYPGSDQEAFAEAIERHRNQTPDWVPPDAVRYRRAVDMSKASGDRKITVKEALSIGLADDTAWPKKEDRIRKWLEDNGAQSVIKLKELDKMPGGAGLRFRDRTGISNTPDAIVDGVTTETKSITSKNGINNRGRKGKNRRARSFAT